MKNYQWLFILVLLGAAMGCKGRAEAPQAPASMIQIGALTGLNGVVEPCGCTSTPLGGLDRTVARIEALGKGPFGLVVTGDTFFERDDPPVHLREQERAKGSLIAGILGGLSPLAVVSGPRDRKLGEDQVSAWALEHELPLFRDPRNVSSHFRVDHVIEKVGGRKVGFIGLPGDLNPEEAGSISRGALALRAQGAELVVALLPVGGTLAREFAGALNGVDVAIGGGGESDDPPSVIKGTLLVDAGVKGKNLGVLAVHWLGSGRAANGFVYSDEGRVRTTSLKLRIKRLEGTLKTLAAGPGRAVREDKLQSLKAELQAFTPELPRVPYVTWRREPIEKNLPAAGWATKRLAKYNRSLCDITHKATAELPCEVPLKDADHYVGNQKCLNCHPEAERVYQGTRHAHAWATLEEVGKTCDPGCIGCHTVGFNKAGGYCRLVDAEKNRNVGCENCHGPGAGHVAQPFKPESWSEHFRPDPGAEVCLDCHNSEHSDQFEFRSYLEKILGPGHGKPLK